MKSTSHVDLDKIVVTSPALSIITYSLFDAYRMIVTHERRHLQHAKRVADEAAFPSGLAGV